MIDSVADQLLKQFAFNFAAQVQAKQAQASESAVPAAQASTPATPVVASQLKQLNALALIWAVIKDWLRSLFGAKRTWCRIQGLAPQTMVLLHLAAMFGPALLLRQSIAHWSLRTLSIVCTILLASGAAWVTWAAAPFDLIGLAVTHGAAWGLAWAGQLWAPARRGQQGTSPLLAAAGYALVTLGFGLAVEHSGARGVAVVHVALGLGAITAWLVKGAPAIWPRSDTSRRHPATMSPPSQHGAGR